MKTMLYVLLIVNLIIGTIVMLLKLRKMMSLKMTSIVV